MRRFFVSFISAIAFSAVLTSTGSASDGALPTGGIPFDVVVQPDGRILMGAASGSDAVVGRYLPTGKTDSSFGGGAVKAGKGYPRHQSLALQADGKVLYLFGNDVAGVLKRFNANGSIDAGFGNGGIVETPATASAAIEVQSDGRILVAGSDVECDRYTRCSGPSTFARFRADGSLDPDFGDDGKETFPSQWSTETSESSPVIESLELDSEGHIYAGTNISKMFRLEPDGTHFPGGLKTLDNGGAHLTIRNDLITSVSRIPGTIGFGLARNKLNGTPDGTFGAGGIAPIDFGDSILREPFQEVPPQVSVDGSVVLAGSVTFRCNPQYSCQAGPLLKKFSATGAPDTSWGDDGTVARNLGTSGALGLAADTQLDGKLIVATTSTVQKGRDPFRISLMRYDANGQLDASFGKSGIRSIPGQYPSCLGRPADQVVSGGKPTNAIRSGNTMLGSAANDRMTGKAGSNFICGKGGRDRLSGRAGNDRVSGGSGADRIFGGPGNDRVLARDGFRDLIFCGPGRDVAVVDRKDVTRKCEKVVRPR